MSTNSGSALYGCIRLSGTSTLDLSFLPWDKIEQGNHLGGFDSQSPKPFDYWHGGQNTDHVKQIVAARNTVFTGFKTKTQYVENPMTRLTHSIMSMRQDIEDDRNAGSSFLDKIFHYVYPKLDGRLCISLDMTSAMSQFVLLARDTSIYLTSFGDNRSRYLIWSNEQSIEQQIRQHLGEKAFYYRHMPLVNGVMVIQSQFLASKFVKWNSKLSDLVTMNALDVFLQRKTRTTAGAEPVNQQANPTEKEAHT